MRYIPENLRKLVIERARNRCEYCGLSQLGQEATFHIDHIVPITAGGATHLENLALACVSCSLRKSARQTAIDPVSGEQVSIFHPRLDKWDVHFRWDGVHLIGLTASGRATIQTLQLNRRLILAIRKEEMLLRRHPPE